MTTWMMSSDRSWERYARVWEKGRGGLIVSASLGINKKSADRGVNAQRISVALHIACATEILATASADVAAAQSAG